MGLHQAFPDAEIVGVDIRPQPRYPFTFVQGDALEYAVSGFDFVWASPPCQAHTTILQAALRKQHTDLIPPTRNKLIAAGPPYIIENVVGAPLLTTVQLCGTAFGLTTRRHRHFECSFLAFATPCRHIRSQQYHGVYGDHPQKWVKPGQLRCPSLEDARRAMGIDWMDWHELTQAIPPAYSRYLAQFIPIKAEAAA